MDLDPTYYLWHPSVHAADGLSIVTINITPGSSASPPAGRAFVSHMLSEIGVDVPMKSWDVLAYRSTYHGDGESAFWKDRWPQNWRLTITLEKALSALPPLQHEYKETYALSDVQAPPLHEKAAIGCVIISDFKCTSDAERAKQEIHRSRHLTDFIRRYSVSDPKFLIINLSATFVQLQAFLGGFTAEFFEDGAEYGLAVDAVCRGVGGITSFDERADEWGELYNPAGIG